MEFVLLVFSLTSDMNDFWVLVMLYLLNPITRILNKSENKTRSQDPTFLTLVNTV